MNKDSLSLNPVGPIVIGGVGGSGTRLVAKILIEARFFLGSDLNLENDNLWFTMLFRRPRWYRKVVEKSEDRIFVGLGLLTKAMLGGDALSPNEIDFLIRAVTETSLNIRAGNKATRGVWPFRRARNLLRAASVPLEGDYRGWGWKEPNSHIYLPYLSQHFPALKYIHVIRHGLDLAFSINQVQLHNWFFLFDLKRPQSKSEVPSASLKYWVRANQRALDLGKKLGPDHFLLVDFDRLCRSPGSEIARIFEFIGSQVPDYELARLAQLPQKETSSGRYLQHDCSVFDAVDVEAVRQLGFEVKL